MSEEIPLIDFGQFLNGTEEDRRKVSMKIGNACRDIGFFYLLNHGVPSSIIVRVYEQAQRFFAQKNDEKMNYYIGLCPHKNNRGYTPFYEEKLSIKGDIKEAFDCALELPEDDPDRIQRGALLCGPNFWPDNLPGFRECLYDEYFKRMLSLSNQLLESFSVYLNLPKTYFQDVFKKPMATMRIIHYPPHPVENGFDEDQLGCGAHTDYECFTLLSQSNQSGLEILNKQGRWIKATPIENAFVVNIGDMMQRWTNDLFKSTVHRVINNSDNERYSIPFFYGPNYFTSIQSLMQHETAKYEPICAGEYIKSRFNDTYHYRQSNST